MKYKLIALLSSLSLFFIMAISLKSQSIYEEVGKTNRVECRSCLVDVSVTRCSYGSGNCDARAQDFCNSVCGDAMNGVR